MQQKRFLKRTKEYLKEHKWVRIPLGILFVIIGFIGGFIPIFQGWVFGVLGLTLLFGEVFTDRLKNIFKIKK